MKVAAFELGSCPAVPASEASAARAAGRVLGALPQTWQVALPPFGSAAVIVTGIDAAGVTAEASALTVLRGRNRGRLVVAGGFATRLIDGVLGGSEFFAAARELGPAERGVLVALLAPVLDVFGAALDLAPPGDDLAREAPAVALRLEGSFGAGTLWLQLPWSELDAALDARRAAGLPVEARIELGVTLLPAAALADLAAGDAVVFDGIGFGGFAADRVWAARLVTGAHAADLGIDPAGALSVTGAFQSIGAAGERTVAVTKEETMDVTGPTEMAAKALADAPIEVVAELARLTLRGEEVLGLVPGAVLAVALERTRAITLRAGGEPWAEGELVDVDGQLGVRVTRLLRG